MTNLAAGNLVKVTNSDRLAFGRVILISSLPSSRLGMCMCGVQYCHSFFEDGWGRDYCAGELSFLYASPSVVPLEEAAALISQLDSSSFFTVVSEIKENFVGQIP